MPPSQLTVLSQSSLQDYTDCARRFQLRYLERLSYPAVESEPALENEKHLREGEFFHRLVQQHLIGVPGEQVGRLANTDNLKRWWANFINSENLTGLKDLSGFFNYFLPNNRLTPAPTPSRKSTGFTIMSAARLM